MPAVATEGLLPVLEQIDAALQEVAGNDDLLRLRDAADAAQTIAAKARLDTIAVEASILRARIEREIVTRNPPLSRGGAHDRGSMSPQGDMVHRRDLSRMRKAYRGMHDDLFDSLARAARESTEPLTRQAAAQAMTRHRIAVRRRAATERRAERDAAAPNTRCEIHHCDIARLPVADGSVDVIVTDPPYARDALGCWDALAEFAARTLRPGGTLCTLTGSIWLPDVVLRLTHQELRWRWAIPYVMLGCSTAVQVARIHSAAKLMLLYTRTANDDAHPDTWIASPIRVPDRRYQEADLHPAQQQQDGWQMVVDRLCSPGDVVCDPYIGSGTTAVCARARGCGFIGGDADADAVATARRRLEHII